MQDGDEKRLFLQLRKKEGKEGRKEEGRVSGISVATSSRDPKRSLPTGQSSSLSRDAKGETSRRRGARALHTRHASIDDT